MNSFDQNRIVKLKLVFVLFSLFFFNQLFSQQLYQGYNTDDNQLVVYVDDGSFIFTPYNEKIIKCAFKPKNGSIIDYGYAIYMQPEKTSIQFSENKNEIQYSTSFLKVIIEKSPFNIKYYANGTELINATGYLKTDSSSVLSFNISNDEVLYGAGARVLGMNRRGYKLALYNRAHYGYTTHSELMNYTLPLFLSSKKYALLFDNPAKGWLDLDSQHTNIVNYEAVSGAMVYYLIADCNWNELIGSYTALTGRQPMPPRWAMGNFSSRFGYRSQKETEATVQQFIDDSIPLDAVVIDIYWFGKDIQGSMGNLDWYTDSFPDPQPMIRKFDQLGVKTILVTEPFILTTSSKWNDALAHHVITTDTLGKPFTYNFYFGHTGLIDIFKPEARNWFWGIYKDLTLQGIGGWWGDLGEPEVHPKDLMHFNGMANDIHNVYGQEWARLIYEGYKSDFPETRPFILMRAGYAGSQRYGMIPWTGDVLRDWGGLYAQPEISLQMGMQGLAYTHSDLGGFADGDTIDNELYIRWLQYGIFQPIYRPHAQEHIPAEPVFQNDTTKAYAKNAIELRYQLLPYLYNMAYQNHQKGTPLMRPLFFEEPDNIDLLIYDKAYLWGDAFLVSPVKEKGIKTQSVYLPKNNFWFNYYSDSLIQGGKTINVPLSIKNIPVFVKAGSFIPKIKTIQHTNAYTLADFELNYYFHPLIDSSYYELYNDDGITPLSSETKSELFQFSAISSENYIEIKVVKQIKNKAITEGNTIHLKIHGMMNEPKSVIISNKVLSKTEWNFDPLIKCIEFEISNDNRDYLNGINIQILK